MRTVLIQLNDSKALKILQDLEEVKLIKLISSKEAQDNPKKELQKLVRERNEPKDLLSAAGIWKDRDEVSLNTIRKEAWPDRK